MKAGKIWGDTESLLVTPMIEVHRINVLPHMHCSMHKHNMKWNMFYVIKGRLYIEVEKNNYDLTDVTELFQGQHTSVKPNEFHRFFTKDEPVEALEVYYLNSISEDIVRKTVGGVE